MRPSPSTATLRASLNLPAPVPSLPNLSATLAKPGADGVCGDADDGEPDEGTAWLIFFSTADLIMKPTATVTPTMTRRIMTHASVNRLIGRTRLCGLKVWGEKTALPDMITGDSAAPSPAIRSTA